MAIKVACTCGRPFSVDDSMAGAKAFCPVCGVQNTVPAKESSGVQSVLLIAGAVLLVGGLAGGAYWLHKHKRSTTVATGTPGGSGVRLVDKTDPGGRRPPGNGGPTTTPTHTDETRETTPVTRTGPDRTPDKGDHGGATSPDRLADDWWLGLPGELQSKFTDSYREFTLGTDRQRARILLEWVGTGDRKLAPLIEALLQARSEEERRAALVAAVILDVPVPPEAIGKLLQDTDPSQRALAMIVAGMKGVEGAVKEIRPFLSDKDLRPFAIQALGLLHDSGSIPEIARYLADPDAILRESAFEALGYINTFPGGFPVDVLRDPDPSVKATGVVAAGRVREATLLAQFAQLLQDTDPRMRRAGAEALGMMGQQASAPNLLPLLRDTDPSVRYEAARSLGRLRSRVAVAPIEGLLDDRAAAPGVSDVEAFQVYLDAAKRLDSRSELPAVAPEVRAGALLALEDATLQHFEGGALDERIMKARDWWLRAPAEYPR